MASRKPSPGDHPCGRSGCRDVAKQGYRYCLGCATIVRKEMSDAKYLTGPSSSFGTNFDPEGVPRRGKAQANNSDIMRVADPLEKHDHVRSENDD